MGTPRNVVHVSLDNEKAVNEVGLERQVSNGSSCDLEKAEQPWSEQDVDTTVAPTKSKPRSFADIQWVVLNTLSTVIIVFLNKIVLSDPQLRHCQISMAMWHFAATSIVLYLATCRPLYLFEATRVPVIQVLPICIFFTGFLLLGNLSLALNSVDFYQLAKIMTTPTVVALNFLLFGKSITSYTLATVLATCAGVALVTSKTLSTNAMGTIVAAAAFTVTALYQIWIGKKIESLKVSPAQLLLNQAPVSVVVLLVIMPFVDTLPDISMIPTKVVYAWLLSGILASTLNLSQFMIIGRTSPLTFNIISHIKTISILSISWIVSRRSFSLVEIIGVMFALGGAYQYSMSVLKQK